MTGSQMFVLVFLLGGAVALAVLLAGLGFYYQGKNSGRNRGQDESN